MNEKIALTVKNVTVSYSIISRMSISKNFFGRKEEKKEVPKAVNDVSFEVNKGEIIGIVGLNGSGKSTLLRSIAGILKPDDGVIDTHGHRVSLMSIGVGFKPEVTGRDNIFLSGMLLGFSESEIKGKMEEIIEFSELDDYIDRPVRTYSSGMYSKLSFAITALMNPDIMLVDEVLSVGDTHFQEKSFKKMQELIQDEERTVIIVSHDISLLSNLCNKVLWMHKGKLERMGDTSLVIDEYLEYIRG